ncbi:MAG: glycoside hydrolase family 2 TIM barrel-domain containing protein [Ignavibacteria bacterium]|jgi:hypothetical protein
MKTNVSRLGNNLAILFASIFSIVLFTIGCSAQNEKSVSLSGEWNFQIDSLDVGESEHWFSKELSDNVKLPGSMAANGKGNDITLQTEWTGGIRDAKWYKRPSFAKFENPDSIRFPFWLQPVKKYTGAAWYQKEISIPSNWNDKDISLKLERCHWETTVWIDDTKLGKQNSLSTPHIYELSGLSEGKHLLTIKVDNRRIVDVGRNSHSISDHTQSNWNGIVGEISLSKKRKIFVENILIKPSVKNKSVEIALDIKDELKTNKNISIDIFAQGINGNTVTFPTLTKQVELNKESNEINIEYSLGEKAKLWDEFNPNVYTLNVALKYDDKISSYSETFGLREIAVDNKHIKVNGRRIFLRGTLECAIFPKTGYPSTDKNEWKRIYKVIKSFGLNHMRFHSWCPPEAAFDAADEEGVYLQVECGSWANQSTTLGDGKPVDDFVWEESKRIVKEYGNHPSFCFMAYGNEPGGKNHAAFLADFLNYWKKQDNRRLYTGAAGWPAIPENQYHDIPEPRVQGWGQQLNSIINGESPRSDYNWEEIINSKDKPVVSHEIGQWCVYPSFKEIKKYTGVLKAKNFELFRDKLEANNMGDLADKFLIASGKLQTLCYKADIEAALRTKDMGGFQLLDLHDFPGQGTALVGVLDPFWDEKGYVTANEYSRFCNSTVPLAIFPKFIFSSNEKLNVPVEAAHFGAETMKGITPTWQIIDSQNKVIANGSLSKTDIPIGNGISLGNIEYSLNPLTTPAMYKLEVAIDSFKNSWDFWVYPNTESTAPNDDIKIVQEINDETLAFINNGGKALITPKKGSIKDDKGGSVGVGFSSIFWNTAWTDQQAPHTLGILCDPNSALLKEFPTESHSNYQWWDAMSHSNAILLSELGDNIKPTVRIIDDWFTARPLGLIIEAKIGKGKIVLIGIDLMTDIDNRLEAKQLLKSISSYMESDAFNPNQEIESDKLKYLFN